MRTEANVSGNEAHKSTEGVPNFDLENARRDLIGLRTKHGADTPIGHRCSNIAEMLDNGAPPALIAKQMAELERLLAAEG